MLTSPMKRIWPSLRARMRLKTSRQRAGLIRGISPSMTNTSASAVSSSFTYLRAGAALPEPEPRMALKKSLPGSTTITSLFLLKLAR